MREANAVEQPQKLHLKILLLRLGKIKWGNDFPAQLETTQRSATKEVWQKEN